MKLSLPVIAALLGQTSATIFYAGMAESGGEFGVWSQDKVKGTGLPGRFGGEYSFIGEKGVDTFVDTHHVKWTRWVDWL
jgi:endoglucanase